MTLMRKAHPAFRFLILGLALLILCTTPAFAATQVKQVKTFGDPTEAFGFLVASMQKMQKKDLLPALRQIFGADTDKILASVDSKEERTNRDIFLRAYRTYHAVEVHNGNEAYLAVGKSAWIFPVPVVKVSTSPNAKPAWKFDTAKGLREIQIRKIGRNERFAIQACLAYVDAQRDYFDMNPLKEKNPQYARKFKSSPDSRDGLYWPAASADDVSPLGVEFAEASAGKSEGQLAFAKAAFGGYYYKILFKQGTSASGGAYDYDVGGRMIGGFALLAYPAVYKDTGVMSFIVNHDGLVYEKNLGADTEKIAGTMEAFDPDSTWRPVDPVYMQPTEPVAAE